MSVPRISSTVCPIPPLETERPSQSATVKYVQGLFFLFSLMSLVKDMLHHAVHIGSDTKHWSPAMKPYIHGQQNGIHVFDLTKTEKHLAETKKALEEFCKSGKELLIVGTKVQTQKIAQDLAEKTGHASVTSVWVPGLLTNYNTIKRQIREYNKIMKDIETGEINRLSKKEKAMVMTRLTRLKKRYEGIKDLKKAPEGIFVIDGHYELQAIKEANVLGLTVFAILGTTGQPKLCDHFVPANVNNLKSLTFITDELSPAMKRTARETVAEKIAKKPAPKKEEAAAE